jgi:beta-galactosidase
VAVPTRSRRTLWQFQRPFTYGGRKGYNTNSPNFLAASKRITGALAEHYGRYPNVIGWQLDNEPGHPPQSFDPVSEKAFQMWLRQRYGTLDELNRVWNGAFWSNRFSEWSEVRFPSNSAEGGWQPAISLEYHRFFSDSFLNHLRIQAEILHAKTENQFVFTNWHPQRGPSMSLPPRSSSMPLHGTITSALQA